MSFKKTVILAVIVIAAFLYLSLVKLPRKELEIAREMFYPRGLGSRIDEIIIETAEGGRINFSNKHSKSSNNTDTFGSDHIADISEWEIKGVKGSLLNKENFEQLLIAIRDFRLGKPIPDDGEIDPEKVYGFARPTLKITVKSDNTGRTVVFGKRNDFVGLRYARLDGEQHVYLVGEKLFSLANHPLIYFRDVRPFKFVDTALKTIEISNSSGDITLENSEKLDWRIVAPIQTDASDEKIADLTRFLRSTTVEEFFDNADKDPAVLSRYGLNDPDLILNLNFRNGEREKVLIEGYQGVKDAKINSYIWIEGTSSVMGLRENYAEQLDKPVDFFREDRLLKITHEDIDQIDFELAGEPPITLKLVGPDNWLVNGKQADLPFVHDLLKNIVSLKAKEFPTEPLSRNIARPRLKALIKLKSSSDSSAPSEHLLLVGSAVKRDGKLVGYYASVDNGLEVIIDHRSFLRIFPRAEILIKNPRLEAESAPLLPQKN
ncbi:MAG: DUF4340 domain-containing protein [Candidatus Dadabacteria bacterium]|nr:MAG: DUF4340 domain-containing protein [Candidatus Dadabacteria bacterium]